MAVIHIYENYGCHMMLKTVCLTFMTIVSKISTKFPILTNGGDKNEP